MAINAVKFGLQFAVLGWMPSVQAARFGWAPSSAQAYAGAGYLGGEKPSSDDPTELDGRFRILGQPARGRIHVYDRGTSNCVASVHSASDGTWRVDRLSPGLLFTVIGYDDTGAQNAAIQDWVRPAERLRGG